MVGRAKYLTFFDNLKHACSNVAQVNDVCVSTFLCVRVGSGHVMGESLMQGSYQMYRLKGFTVRKSILNSNRPGGLMRNS